MSKITQEYITAFNKVIEAAANHRVKNHQKIIVIDNKSYDMSWYLDWLIEFEKRRVDELKREADETFSIPIDNFYLMRMLF